MLGEGWSREEVQRIAAAVLGRPVSVERQPVGFGNESWMVRDTGGTDRWVLKVGPLESEAKWRSAHAALVLARDAGIAVPELVHVARHDDRLVRIFAWLDGSPPAEVISDPTQLATFTDTLAAALRALHSTDTGAFGSRLDGSSPTYERWADYLGARLDAVEERCRAAGAPDERTCDRAARAIRSLAADVSAHARPTLCHRDLHGDNLLVDGTGALCGIIDWDAAESWDPAGEWFKLEWMLASDLGLDGRRLAAAYAGGRPLPARWHERVRVVHLIEALNTIPNAIARGDRAFAVRALEHLERLLDADPA